MAAIQSVVCRASRSSSRRWAVVSDFRRTPITWSSTAARPMCHKAWNTTALVPLPAGSSFERDVLDLDLDLPGPNPAGAAVAQIHGLRRDLGREAQPVSGDGPRRDQSAAGLPAHRGRDLVRVRRHRDPEAFVDPRKVVQAATQTPERPALCQSRERLVHGCPPAQVEEVLGRVHPAGAGGADAVEDGGVGRDYRSQVVRRSRAFF
jgi:hypothetical protein